MMRAWWKLSVIQLKLFLREPEGVFFTVVFPLVLLITFGSIFGNEPVPEFGGRGTIDVSVPAYIGLVVAISGLMSIPVSAASDREKGVLRRLRSTPVRPHAVLAAWVGVFFIVTALGSLLLVLVGRLFYGLRFGGSLFNMVMAFTLSTLSLFALGFIIASVARSGRVATVIGMATYFPMVFLSGATFPWEMIPKKVQTVAMVLPLTHGVQLLKGLWFGEPWSAHLVNVAVLLGTLIGGVVISATLFRWE